MEIPKRITILGKKFKVSIVDRKSIEDDTGRDADGAMNFGRKIILISNDLEPDDQLITYLHECHHAISYITGFSQVRSAEVFELEAECYANGFFDVFKGLLK